MEENIVGKQTTEQSTQNEESLRVDCPEFVSKPIPNWDEHCKKCIIKNGCKPEEMLYCPAEDNCDYYATREGYE